MHFQAPSFGLRLRRLEISATHLAVVQTGTDVADSLSHARVIYIVAVAARGARRLLGQVRRSRVALILLDRWRRSINYSHRLTLNRLSNLGRSLGASETFLRG